MRLSWRELALVRVFVTLSDYRKAWAKREKTLDYSHEKLGQVQIRWERMRVDENAWEFQARPEQELESRSFRSELAGYFTQIGFEGKVLRSRNAELRLRRWLDNQKTLRFSTNYPRKERVKIPFTPSVNKFLARKWRHRGPRTDKY